MVALGEEIRRARVSAGLNQAAVGRAVGLFYSTIGRIERGIAPRAVSWHLLALPLSWDWRCRRR